VAPRFAVDHDFPEPILRSVQPFLPLDLELISRIDKRLVDRLDDWEVILALSQIGYEGLVTLDASMLELPRELAVVHQTNFTLFAIEAAGNNALRATGQLLLHIRSVATQHDPTQPQLFRVTAPRGIHPNKAWDRLGQLASGQGVSIQQLFNAHRLSASELTRKVLS
jgi:hypothetical protein